MIRTLLLTFAAVLMVVLVPDSDAVLVAHYEFESSSVLGLDSAGGDNNGVQTGADSAYTSSSRLGTGALTLDGTGTGLRLDNSAAFQNLTTFTIAAFVRPDLNSATWGGGSVPVGRVFGSVGADGPGGTQFGDGNGYGFGLYDYGIEGGLRYTSFLVADFDITAASLPNPIQDDEWVHVAVVVTGGSPATAEFYVDGVSVGSIEGGDPNPTVDPFHVGASGGGNTDSFAGLMDDVRFYDEALDATTIANLASPADDGQQGLVFSIDRTLGTVTLTNDSAFSTEIRGYSLTSNSNRFAASSWLSISDNYDQGNGSATIDSDDDWLEFSSVASDLSEGTQGEVTLAGSQVVNLGPAWRKGPTEDVVAEVLLADGTTVQAIVEFNGNGDESWKLGDLDFDNDVDLDDFDIYNAGLFTTSMNPEASDTYLLGDLDGDLDNDFFDFLLFKNAYVAAGGNPAALAFGASVPEPSTTALFMLGALGMVGLRKFPRKLAIAALACVSTTLAATTSQAALLPVFEYSFPASFEGKDVSNVIVDQSSAGNNGLMDSFGDNGDMIDDRPAGFDSSLMSISGSNGSHGRTDAIDLLDNASAVEPNGGFLMDVWMKWDGFTGVRKMIDYAGTEYLRTDTPGGVGQVQFGISNGATVLSHPIVQDQWYHVQGHFRSGNSQTDDNGDLTGNAFLVVDGTVVDSAFGVSKTSFGDSLNRQIALNRWPNNPSNTTTGADYNQGLIFNPSVFVGTLVIPEPSTIVLTGLILSSCFLMKRRSVRIALPSLLLIAAVGASTAQAQFTSIFEYSFPASFEGKDVSNVIVDQSSTGNNGLMDAFGANGDLIDDRPTGFDASLMSISGSNGGHGRTDAIDLLDNATVIEPNGGFLMDVWMKWDGFTGVRKMIDYAGTEYLRTNTPGGVGNVQFGLSNGATVLSHPIVQDQWYHVQGYFQSGTNQTDGNGNLAGNAFLIVDGTVVDSAFGVSKTNFGDSLNRQIGLNRWPNNPDNTTTGADFNQGLIFNPSVYVGQAAEPMRLTIDPSTGDTSIVHTPNALLPDDREIDFYQITSASGALTTGTWQSLEDSGLGGGNSADYNADGTVNIADYTVWRNALGSTGSGLAADGNGDMVVDSADYILWKDNFGATGGSGAGWTEAGILTSSLVGESFLTGSTLFDNGMTVDLGELWNENSIANPATDLVFQYHVVGESGLRTGAIDLVAGSLNAATNVPEPATLVLFSLTAAGFVLARRRVVRRSVLSLVATSATLLTAASMALASSTNDRVYPFGESSGDGGVDGVYVVDSAFQATFDDEYTNGNLSGTAHDLLAFEYNGTEAVQAPNNAGPQFTSVAGRPLATGTPVGVRFDGVNDLLIGARLGLPQSSASSLTGNTAPPTQGSAGTGPFDYSAITRRGFQLWVNPDESNAVFGTAQQAVVMDSSQHGVLISDTGSWVLSYNGANVNSGVTVKNNSIDNGWSHVMVVSPNGGPFVGSILYVDGEALAAEAGGYTNNDFPLVIGANTALFDPTATAPNPLFAGGTTDYFAGSVDQLSMFVLGTSIGGVDYGTFNLAADNEFVADALQGYGPADLNGDGSTTGTDVNTFIANWGSVNLVNDLQVGDLNTRLAGDFNFDGTVDLNDWQILTENYSGPGALNLDALLAGQAIPEPSSLAIATVVGVLLCVCRRGCQ